MENGLLFLGVMVWIGIGYLTGLIIDSSVKTPLGLGPRLTVVLLGPINAFIYIFEGHKRT